VSPEFIGEMRELSGEELPAEKLVELKIHGVDRDFFVRMKDGLEA